MNVFNLIVRLEDESTRIPLKSPNTARNQTVEGIARQVLPASGKRDLKMNDICTAVF
jgi:hypothetical protein